MASYGLLGTEIAMHVLVFAGNYVRPEQFMSVKTRWCCSIKLLTCLDVQRTLIILTIEKRLLYNLHEVYNAFLS